MSIFINTEDKSSNLEKFLSGHTNKLLVIGYSGSGKTTLSKQLATKYNAKYICLDDFFFNNQELKKTNPNLYKVKRSEYEINLLFGNGRYVIEGVGVLKNKPEVIYDLSTIILGTSLLVSSFRGAMRNQNANKTTNSKLHEILIPFQKNIFKYHKLLHKYLHELTTRHEIVDFKLYLR